MPDTLLTMKYEEWLKEAERRFGPDSKKWAFVCPSCGHEATLEDWHKAGAPEGAIAFSCIGRWSTDPETAAKNAFQESGGPCNYAGGGLFNLNPLTVIRGDESPHHVFAFADPRHETPHQATEISK